MNISRPGRLILTTLSLTAIAAPSLAQEGTGLRGKLSFNQALEYSDNPDLLRFPVGDKAKSVTTLRFDLDSETRTERFNFFVGGQGIGASGDGATGADDFAFQNEEAGISYSREGSNSRLTLGANYSSFDLADEVFGFFVDGQFDNDAVIVDSGKRNTTNFRAFFEYGIEGPFGLEADIRVSERDYVDTFDIDLEDLDRETFDGVARFRINPALTARLLTGIDNQKYGDATMTKRRNTYVGVGLEGETGGGLSYSADLTLDRSKTTEFGSITSDEDGVGFSVTAIQDRPDGSLGLEFGSRIDDSGRRTSASIQRSIDLPNGALSLALGLVDQEDSDTEITTHVTYTRELADRSISANIVQQPTTDDGAAFLNTTIQLNYEQAINSVSSWDAALSYGSTSEFGDADSDTRTSATIAYSHDLTEDWRLRAGISTTRINDDDGDDRSQNTVFLSVGRDFSFGF